MIDGWSTMFLPYRLTGHWCSHLGAVLDTVLADSSVGWGSIGGGRPIGIG